MAWKLSERNAHRIRWTLTWGWFLLIFSLFYDPISPILTHPDNHWSPFHLNPDTCVKLQGTCLDVEIYPLGASIFWGIVIPSSIFILLVFGHEAWRRICPLSFLSQLPAALGWQRRKKNTKNTKRPEPVRIAKDSWLGRNYLYVQFAWLYLGLCARILFINSDRLALALWLLFTIGCAMAIGYLYGGKSWCHYFCPMAPVQKVFAEPQGILTTKAHTSKQTITQSMCPTGGEDGQEQSTCVACKSPCLDIDAERSYWETIKRPDHQWLYYAYLGLVVGYFAYYYLYAGNWRYYFSGAWTHEEEQLENLLSSGFYIFHHPLMIPKLLAVPLTLGIFSWLGYRIGCKVENFCKVQQWRRKSTVDLEEIRHHLFSLCTYFAFNLLFLLGCRPIVSRLPLILQYLFEVAIVLLGILWLGTVWQRSPRVYLEEKSTTRKALPAKNKAKALSSYSSAG